MFSLQDYRVASRVSVQLDANCGSKREHWLLPDIFDKHRRDSIPQPQRHWKVLNAARTHISILSHSNYFHRFSCSCSHLGEPLLCKAADYLHLCLLHQHEFHSEFKIVFNARSNQPHVSVTKVLSVADSTPLTPLFRLLPDPTWTVGPAAPYSRVFSTVPRTQFVTFRRGYVVTTLLDIYAKPTWHSW